MMLPLNLLRANLPSPGLALTMRIILANHKWVFGEFQMAFCDGSLQQERLHAFCKVTCIKLSCAVAVHLGWKRGLTIKLSMSGKRCTAKVALKL